MTTPIIDFLHSYEKNISLRLHMPGHKGRFSIHPLADCHLMDITEVKGADSLYEAEGIIAESERNAAEVFSVKHTFYSAGGSTLGIQTMLTAVVGEKGKIVAARNAHRAFVNTCALIDADVIWVTGENADVISSLVTPSDIEKALSKEKDADAVYITSPDYYGRIADIKGISDVCKKYGVPLIVDNAHGSHLAFLEENIHPITLGADICCDSAHKTLPVLTGGGYIHTNSDKYASLIKEKQSLYGSSSPSYLILASLDFCNFTLHETGINLMKMRSENMEKIKSRLSPVWSFIGDDILHLTVEAYKAGLSGYDLSERLRESGIECEYCDEYYVTFLFSITSDEEDYDALADAMEKIIHPKILIRKDETPFVLPQKAMRIREATFSESEKIPVDNAKGRICAHNITHCPPCIPIVVAGEIIDENSINILKRYSICEINVVK